jgi:hypothetical protein
MAAKRSLSSYSDQHRPHRHPELSPLLSEYPQLGLALTFFCLTYGHVDKNPQTS